jgi:hypothetical protein
VAVAAAAGGGGSGRGLRAWQLAWRSSPPSAHRLGLSHFRPPPSTPSNPDDIDFPAAVAGPGWSVPLTAHELADLLTVLAQLRAAVGGLQEQGQWLPAAGDRPVSRAKVRGAGGQAGGGGGGRRGAPRPGRHTAVAGWMGRADPLPCPLRARPRSGSRAT